MNAIINVDHRKVACELTKISGGKVRVTPIKDAGHNEETDRHLQLLGMAVRRDWNNHGFSILSPENLTKLNPIYDKKTAARSAAPRLNG